jgi:ubiquinone/menaquinone biosynthesis C-methylase UbiE
MSKHFQSDIEKLRSKKRLERLEVERVVGLSLEGIHAECVLDVGTGSGVFAEAFVPWADEITGIDSNPEMLEVARKYVPAAKFQEGVAEALPSADDEYDLVFLGHVLHESDEPLTVILEAKRCAKKSVAVLEWPYQDEKMGPSIEGRVKPDEIIAMAQKAGFQNVEKISLSHMMLYRLTI